MTQNSILFFDSGIGGLSLFRESRILLPYNSFIYIADDKAFPYGNWQQDDLKQHLLELFAQLFSKFDCKYIVIACNTASMVALNELRETYPEKVFIGTIPAIKVAAERTKSLNISVLATPITINRSSTQQLIKDFAQNIHVNLVGSAKLAALAESYLKGIEIDKDILKQELSPVFTVIDNRKTDIVVLACTHYPFLLNFFRECAAWPVDWIDPSTAIAQKLKRLFKNNHNHIRESKDIFSLTSKNVSFLSKRLFQAFGLEYQDI
ncbi:glutamate racemase [Bartonella sp. DGB1]|uniref:glutamate racemase n=1 Tax=Bartonella sp. DGB1 TaxID=3239807 RepID=UPI0035269CB1